MKILAAVKSFLLKPIGKNDIYAALGRVISAPIVRKKAVLWALILFCAAWFLLQAYPYLNMWDLDSISYYAGAHGLRQHINIYDDNEFQSMADTLLGKGVIVYPYIYPPLLAQLCLPLTRFSPSTFFLLVFIMNVALTFFNLFLLSRLLELDRRPTILPLLFPFALLLFNAPLLTTIDYGQINILVFTATLLYMTFQKKGKPFAAGFFLSLAVFIKIYPILFVLPFIFFKRWKSLAAFIVNSAAMLALSIGVSGAAPWLVFAKSTLSLFFKKPDSPFTRVFQPSFSNVSLKGFLTQGFAQLHLPESPVVPLFLLAAVLLVLWIFVSPRKREVAADLALEGSLLFILSLVLAPITWTHHYVIMMFPAAYLFRRIIDEKKYGAFLLLAFLASQILYELPWGAFPYNQVRFMAVLGFLGMLLHFARTSPKNGYAVWGEKGRARQAPEKITPAAAS
ncbi:MAG: glycosyltransferase family 87 protein [Candidatus Aminicenantes bacterium]|nr:glycosyltransferase family 87 protein [Candidatus Aminicenantes bacterium]